MLNKITGDYDIIIGTDALGRSTKSLMGIAGTFINILPLRMIIDGESQYSEFLNEVKECVIGAFEHQEFQYDQMVSMFSPDVKQFVDVHFSFANTIDSREELKELQFKSIDLGTKQTAPYEFQIEVHANGEFFQVVFIYNDSLYDESVIKAFMSSYRGILNAVINGEPVEIDKIEIELDINSSY